MFSDSNHATRPSYNWIQPLSEQESLLPEAYIHVEQAYPSLVRVKETHKLLGLGVIHTLARVGQVRRVAAKLLLRSVVFGTAPDHLQTHRRGVERTE